MKTWPKFWPEVDVIPVIPGAEDTQLRIMIVNSPVVGTHFMQQQSIIYFAVDTGKTLFLSSHP